MGLGFAKGSEDVIREVFIVDSTTGLAKTGLAWDDAGAIASYNLPGGARQPITLATQTVTGVHSDGGFVEIDATNKKGHYRFDVVNAAFTGADYTNWQLSFPNAHIRPVADALPTKTPSQVHTLLSDADTGLVVIAGALIAAKGSISDSGVAATDFDTDLTEADDFWNGRAIMMIEGPAKGDVAVAKRTGGYLNAGGHFEFDPAFKVSPADGNSFVALSDTFPVGIHKNEALSDFPFEMVLLNGDPATGKTVTTTRLIDNGSYDSAANSASEVSGGTYRIDMAATDLDGNKITWKMTAPGCKETKFTIIANV